MSADVTLDLSKVAMSVVQTVTAVGMVACVGLLLRLDKRVSLIEQQLPTLERVSKRSEHHGREIAVAEERLDGHDKDVARLDRDKEPRRVPLPPGYSLPTSSLRSAP